MRPESNNYPQQIPTTYGVVWAGFKAYGLFVLTWVAGLLSIYYLGEHNFVVWLLLLLFFGGFHIYWRVARPVWDKVASCMETMGCHNIRTCNSEMIAECEQIQVSLSPKDWSGSLLSSGWETTLKSVVRSDIRVYIRIRKPSLLKRPLSIRGKTVTEELRQVVQKAIDGVELGYMNLTISEGQLVAKICSFPGTMGLGLRNLQNCLSICRVMVQTLTEESDRIRS